jgi:hypothetical protein
VSSRRKRDENNRTIRRSPPHKVDSPERDSRDPPFSMILPNPKFGKDEQ